MVVPEARRAIVMPDFFVCKGCDGIYRKTTTDEEMIAECEETFGSLAENEPVETLCDDCYKEFMDWAKERGIVDA